MEKLKLISEAEALWHEPFHQASDANQHEDNID